MARPRYGTPNMELLRGWFALPAELDGPFWAVNLMRYREVADYGAGVDGEPARSGREADDAYAPLGPLAAVGARVALHADVVAQPSGTPTWHRVGIVRYPSRRAFLDMQQRQDFQRQHVHKEAGMELTIVMSCLPVRHADAGPDAGLPDDALVDGRRDRSMVMRVARSAVPLAAPAGELAVFSVEGVILGDERTFTEVVFARGDDPSVLVDDRVDGGGDVDDTQVLVLRTMIDELVASIDFP